MGVAVFASLFFNVGPIEKVEDGLIYGFLTETISCFSARCEMVAVQRTAHIDNLLSVFHLCLSANIKKSKTDKIATPILNPLPLINNCSLKVTSRHQKSLTVNSEIILL